MARTRTARRGWSLAATAAATAAAALALQLPSAAAAVPAAAPPAAAASLRPVVGSVVGPVVGPVVPEPAGPRSAPAREVRTAVAQAREQVARAAAVRAAAVETAAVRAAAAPSPRAAVPPAAPGSPACSGQGWQQRRGAAALASLRPAPSAASAVRFRAARSGLLGLTHLDSRVVEVFVRPCARQSDALLRHVVAHELGHAHDEAHLTPALRQAWTSARGIPAGTPWYGCDRCTDFATPAGDFAETYAQWRLGTSSSRSRMAPAPGPAALQALASRFFGAG